MHSVSVYAQPLTLSTIVDRAILARWHGDSFDDDLSGNLTPTTAARLLNRVTLDQHPAIDGLVATVLALAGLPVDWDDEVARNEAAQQANRAA